MVMLHDFPMMFPWLRVSRPIKCSKSKTPIPDFSSKPRPKVQGELRSALGTWWTVFSPFWRWEIPSVDIYSWEIIHPTAYHEKNHGKTDNHEKQKTIMGELGRKTKKWRSIARNSSSFDHRRVPTGPCMAYLLALRVFWVHARKYSARGVYGVVWKISQNQQNTSS